MTAKEIRDKLVKCPHCRVSSTIHSKLPATKENVIGFYGHVNSVLGKDAKLKKIQSYCMIHELPLSVVDSDENGTEFKVIINFK